MCQLLWLSQNGTLAASEAKTVTPCVRLVHIFSPLPEIFGISCVLDLRVFQILKGIMEGVLQNTPHPRKMWDTPCNLIE